MNDFDTTFARDCLNETMVAGNRSLNIALGIERMALLGLHSPVLTMAIVAILIVAEVFGIQRIRIDDSISQLFHSADMTFRWSSNANPCWRGTPSRRYELWAPSCSPGASLRANGRRSGFDLRPQGGDVARVDISLSR